MKDFAINSGHVFGLSEYEDAPWRIDRLKRIARTAKRLAWNLTRLIALHDHKGTLMCLWSAPPDDEAKKLIENAWDTENESEVQHYVLGSSGPWEEPSWEVG